MPVLTVRRMKFPEWGPACEEAEAHEIKVNGQVVATMWLTESYDLVVETKNHGGQVTAENNELRLKIDQPM